VNSRGKQAILGAGGGGQVFAAHLALRGYEVSIFDVPEFYDSTIKPIQKQNGIYLTTEPYVGDAVPTGFAHVLASTEMKEAVDGAEIIHIIIPAYAQNRFFKELAPLLEGDQIVLVHPGYLGTLELSKLLDKRQKETVVLAEAQTMLYNARNKGPAHAWAFGIKAQYQIAAFPGKMTRKIVAPIQKAFPFPKILPGRNVLEVHLNNFALAAHPSVLLNTGWIEHTAGNFSFWGDGMTPGVTRVVDALDSERTATQSALGFEPISLGAWLIRLYSQYGAKGSTSSEVWQNCRNLKLGYTPKIIGGKKHPITYVDQDVPYLLMSLTSIAGCVGVPTPHSKLISDLACLVNDVDYWKEARTLKKLGLGGLDKQKLLNFFDEGMPAS
jgi:opine dehydrogenase